MLVCNLLQAAAIQHRESLCQFAGLDKMQLGMQKDLMDIGK